MNPLLSHLIVWTLVGLPVALGLVLNHVTREERVEHVHRFDADGVCGCGASACGRCDGRGWVPPYGVSLPSGFDPSEHGERCKSCDGEGA